MRKCVETVVILVMSVVLMGVALTLMRPYGMVGVATALTIGGVYMALMVLVMTARCCRKNQENQDPETVQVVRDSPPPYEQVVSKPPSYRTLFTPMPSSTLAALKQDRALATQLGISGKLANGAAPVSVFTIARGADFTRLTNPAPEASRERTPRRVRFSFDADMDNSEAKVEARPEGEEQRAAPQATPEASQASQGASSQNAT